MTSVDHAVGRKFTGMFTDTESAAGTSCVRFHCRIVNASAAIARSFTVAPGSTSNRGCHLVALDGEWGEHEARPVGRAAIRGDPGGPLPVDGRFCQAAGADQDVEQVAEPATPLRLRASSIGGPPTSSGSPA